MYANKNDKVLLDNLQLLPETVNYNSEMYVPREACSICLFDNPNLEELSEARYSLKQIRGTCLVLDDHFSNQTPLNSWHLKEWLPEEAIVSGESFPVRQMVLQALENEENGITEGEVTITQVRYLLYEVQRACRMIGDRIG
jgi:hypothetical protein